MVQQPPKDVAEHIDGSDLNWRVLLFGAIIVAIATAASPYITLKLGMGVDLSYGGMFLAAALLGHGAARNSRLAIQLNIIQTMVNVASGVAFMVVILAAFFYIQNVFKRDIGFDPTWWQVTVWLFVSANLGVFMGVLPRRMILNDAALKWPSGQAVMSVAETLSDPAATERAAKRRKALIASTSAAGFLTFLRDGLKIITPMAGKKAAALGVELSLEMAGIGIGMLIPLAVGLSGLVGVWFVYTYGEAVGQLAALSGTTTEHWDTCRELIGKGVITEFLKTNCGHAAEYLADESKFSFVVRWMMWPATAMMVAAALTGVLVPLVRSALEKQTAETQPETKADESIPRSWVWTGITVCVIALLWLQDAWFDMPWRQVLVAVAIQPILIIAGARVLGITGQGPVSLMANATQFVHGLIWPAHIMQNLNAAHISADPGASSEATITSFWVARRLGGKFKTLIIAQLLMIPIAALLVPLVFNWMERTYGIGTGKGQLTAPTGLKIASLALVMENGLAALPYGALTASVVGIVLGIVLELLIAVRLRDEKGELVRDEDDNEVQRYPWLLVPSAFGFALILPPSLSIAMAIGSMMSWLWRMFSSTREGSYKTLAKPIGAGLIAGEAMVGAILIPLIVLLVDRIPVWWATLMAWL